MQLNSNTVILTEDDHQGIVNFVERIAKNNNIWDVEEASIVIDPKQGLIKFRTAGSFKTPKTHQEKKFRDEIDASEEEALEFGEEEDIDVPGKIKGRKRYLENEIDRDKMKSPEKSWKEYRPTQYKFK